MAEEYTEAWCGGDLARVTSFYAEGGSLSYTGADGKVVNDRGKYLEVWKKVGREWKCSFDAYNSDLPARCAGTTGARRLSGVIVPVTVISTQNGPWDRNAWRMCAFYGNLPAGTSPSPQTVRAGAALDAVGQ